MGSRARGPAVQVARALVMLVCAAAGMAGAADESALTRGMKAFEEGRDAEAKRALEEALVVDPDSSIGHYGLGLVLARQGDHRRAVESFERALELEPGLEGAHLSLGTSLFELGEYAAAERALERALEEDPANGAAELLLALSLQAQDRWAESIPHFERAAGADPEVAQLASYQVGVSYWHEGRTEEADEALSRAIRMEPTTATAEDARRLQQRVARGDSPDKRWSVVLELGGEYDDDVTIEEIDASSGKSDVAAVFDLDAGFRLIDEADSGLEIGYSFYQNLHKDETDYNLQSHELRALGSREFGDVSAGLSLRYSRSLLDGDRFLDVFGVQPTLGREIVPGWYVDLVYDYQDRNFDDSPRDADRNAFGFDGFWFVGGGSEYFSASYRFIDENADGAEYDFEANAFRIGFRGPLALVGRRVDFDVGWDYEDRDYDNITPSIGQTRDDKINTFRASLTRRFAPVASARLAWEWIDSDSNLPSADYTENVVTMSIVFDF